MLNCLTMWATSCGLVLRGAVEQLALDGEQVVDRRRRVAAVDRVDAVHVRGEHFLHLADLLAHVRRFVHDLGDVALAAGDFLTHVQGQGFPELLGLALPRLRGAVYALTCFTLVWSLILVFHRLQA